MASRKLTIKQEYEVCRLFNSGVDMGVLADRFNVGYWLIRRMLSDYGLIKRVVVDKDDERLLHDVVSKNKYGLCELNVGENALVKGDIHKIMTVSRKIRKKFGFYFLVQPCGKGMVKIHRYK